MIANPAADAPLPGAEREGHEVADAFEAFNAVYEDLCENRIEVVRLIGPERGDADRCARAPDAAAATTCSISRGTASSTRTTRRSRGGSSRDGQRLSAYELNRVDRVPKFIFSNACESGVHSGNGDRYTPGLPPSFAEAFFLRGVSNFVCTAWPVDDGAAPGVRTVRLLRPARPATAMRYRAAIRHRAPAADAHGDAPGPAQDRRPAARRADVGGLSALWQPVLPFLRPGSDEVAAAEDVAYRRGSRHARDAPRGRADGRSPGARHRQGTCDRARVRRSGGRQWIGSGCEAPPGEAVQEEAGAAVTGRLKCSRES